MKGSQQGRVASTVGLPKHSQADASDAAGRSFDRSSATHPVVRWLCRGLGTANGFFQ